MADKPSVPDALSDLWWFFGIMIVLGALWLAGGGPERYGSDAPPQAVTSPLATGVRVIGDDDSGADDYSYQNPTSGGAKFNSALNYRQVTISRGNAAYEYQPGQEYIILRADHSNSGPISISGWTLTNGKGQKLVLQNKRFVEQASARVAITTGALIFDPAGRSVQGPILLNPGDQAYVITGSGKSSGTYPLKTSFKSNKCLGYVEEENGYDLVPPLSSSRCPDLEEEIDLKRLPDQCYDFVRDLSSCHVPKVGENEEGERTVDGETGIPKTCVDYVLPLLTYESCVQRHLGDADFLGDEWRVYLNQRWEMWASRRETITLSDASGNVVDQLSY